MKLFLASLVAFAGLLAGRIASPDDQDDGWIDWKTVAEDSIECGKCWVGTWDERLPRSPAPKAARDALRKPTWPAMPRFKEPR